MSSRTNKRFAELKGEARTVFETVYISQHIRNNMESLHGGFNETMCGFLTDEEMMRINILIRKSVYEALKNIKLVDSGDGKAEAQLSWDIMSFHTDYEYPGSQALDDAYKKYVEDYQGVRKDIYSKWHDDTHEGICANE